MNFSIGHWQKFLLLELKLDQIKSRFESPKFLNASAYHKVGHQQAEHSTMKTVPDDVEEPKKDEKEFKFNFGGGGG